MQKSTLDPQYPSLSPNPPFCFSPPIFCELSGSSWLGFVRKDTPSLATIASTAPSFRRAVQFLPRAVWGPLMWASALFHCKKEPEQSTRSNCSVHQSTFLPSKLWQPGKHPSALLRGNRSECECVTLSARSCPADPSPALLLCLPGLALPAPHQHCAGTGRHWENSAGEEELENKCRKKTWIVSLCPRVTSE